MSLKYKWVEWDNWTETYKSLKVYDSSPSAKYLDESFNSPEAANLAMCAWYAQYPKLRDLYLHLIAFWEHE